MHSVIQNEDDTFKEMASQAPVTAHYKNSHSKVLLLEFG